MELYIITLFNQIREHNETGHVIKEACMYNNRSAYPIYESQIKRF